MAYDGQLVTRFPALFVFSSPHLDCKLLGVGTIVCTAWFPFLCQGQNYSGWAFNSHLFCEGSN